MNLKLGLSAAALATAFAGPAMSAETVNIEVTVEDIAMLEVEKPTGTMTLDVNSPASSMGFSNPANVCGATNLARVRLNTNHDIDYLQMEFPRVRNIRLDPDVPGSNWPNEIDDRSLYEWFGRAENGNNTILGVYPFAAQDDGSTCYVGWHNEHNGYSISSNTNGVWQVGKNFSSSSAGTEFTNGTHVVEFGVSTDWDDTRIDQDVFAEPGVYTFAMQATIVPSP
ncbi:hypothetical protein [Roseovarius salis]|uniref:hypothetical protein n=1 Tax=Roseovarius salis TaxID=3376063 RepID=UPI0037C87FB1